MSKPYVFLVEDDDLLCDALAYVLRESGAYTVATASNGQEALRILASAERVPDVILTDYQMPRMSGDVLISHLRQNPKFAKTPIAVISGMPRTVAGADIVLRKPIMPETLLKTVALLCPDAPDSAERAPRPAGLFAFLRG